MWLDYFPNAQIHGFDITSYFHSSSDRLKLWFGNQENRGDLRQLPHDFDIIIDDGGHTMLQQQISLAELFGHLSAGGTYIIEDLHTSEDTEQNRRRWGMSPTNNTLALLEDLRTGSWSAGQDYLLSPSDFDNLSRQIASIEIVKVKDDSITSRIIKR